MNELLQNINKQVQKYLDENAELVSPETLNLDIRCGDLLVTDDAIIVKGKNSQRLEYYGGFEYVSAGDKATIGDYTFYLDSDARVKSHLELIVK